MASDHKVQPDGVVQTSEDSPHQVLHHGVLILATAVVSMQTGGGFAKTIMAEEIVRHADNCVRPLACVADLINNKSTCLGMASQHTPKMAAFLGVRK